MDAGAVLLTLPVVLPLVAMLIAIPLGRRAGVLHLPVLLGGTLAAAGVVAAVWPGRVLETAVGGWDVPLGIVLRADGLSALMLATAAMVMAPVGLYARPKFAPSTPEALESRAGFLFWPLFMGVWAGLNAVFLAGDLFNIYVGLELLTLSAVPLVCLEGKKETLAAALQYLLFALLGSLFYLLGAVLLYGAYGTLDLVLLAGLIRGEPASWAAGALMTAGLLAKTALFPLHIWLPPAHAGAPAAASAILSALVVKASFYLLVRLWFDLFPGLLDPAAAAALGALGVLAILTGSVLALRQSRLKLMIAYSTMAQLGYLFLAFPLAGGGGDAQPWVGGAWSGGVLHAISHAAAKASMFLAAGLILEKLGHDRIADLGGVGRAMPMVMLAFALAGLSLMGLPPSGGFVAKWLLLTAAMASGAWWWAAAMFAGGLLAAGYVFRVLDRAMAGSDEPVPARRQVARSRQWVVLGLALASVLLGMAPLLPFRLLEVGRAPAVEEGFE